MNFKKIAPVVIILLLLSAETFACGGVKPRIFGWWKQCPQDSQNTGTVGAPLDGGLLALLGVAGVAYYGTRKKKATEEE